MRSVLIALLVLSACAGGAAAAEVTFVYAPASPVTSVAVRGSFNDWGETALDEGDDGVWRVTVEIEPGEIIYKYFVDGQWPADMSAGPDGRPYDADAEDYAEDGYGGRNAVRRLAGAAPAGMPVIEPGPVAEGTIRLHYHRPDGRYRGWGLHVWEDADEDVAWDRPLAPTGRSEYGAFWDVRLRTAPRLLGFIVHRGETKDPDADRIFDLAGGAREIWLVSGREKVFTEEPDVARLPVGDLSRARAHWVSAETIVWPGAPEAESYALHHEPDGVLVLKADGMHGGDSHPLRARGTYADPDGRFPHLKGEPLFRTEGIDAAELLRGRVAVSATGADGRVADATGLQIPGVLDDLFFHDGDLGVVFDDDTPSLALWAPTARNVRLVLFDEPRGDAGRTILPMTRDGGVWRITGRPDWKHRYYLYEVTVYAPTVQSVVVNLVTDPYSRSLARDSERSQIVDLDDPDWMPAGWRELEKPELAAPGDIVLYELHVRDFSARDDLVPEAQRGTYAAFTVDGHGTRHLRSLAGAGLTHIHLLPVYDIATIPEDKSVWPPPMELDPVDPTAEVYQAAINRVRDQDGFNWGYDPYHYGTPEGSYAVDADGAPRLYEFRQMVQALSDMGLRVVMDVVYNHTHASGQDRQSVLDRIVPGYYHRLDDNGSVATSTCCRNTASEHRMMEKLMVDDLVHWARDMKIDGFRFDLMGHHMRANMEAARDALHALTVERDGVDGRAIHLYGEGWDFGEVQGGARGVNATQQNMAGTGIGTFNDRIRDAIRGGSPFTDRREQGYATGLFHDPNGRPGSRDPQKLREAADRIRVGLVGNLRSFRQGRLHGGGIGGYISQPQEAIQYASAHDNETLFDKIQLAAPRDASISERGDMQRLALGVVALSQGLPFFHAGSELLRSKSMDADSYNSGDWFNRLDFSGETSNWGVGLPPAAKNRDRWDIMRPLLEDPALKPTREEILATAEHFRMLLRVRRSSPLFRLRTAADVAARVHFHNLDGTAGPGLIVMSIADEGEGVADLDPETRRLVAVFNPDVEPVQFGDGRWGRFDFRLHPEMVGSVAAEFDRDTGVFRVPARSVAVFVVAQ